MLICMVPNLLLRQFNMSISEEQSETRDVIVPLRWLFNEDNRLDDFGGEIESTYKGLGLPVLYGVLSILANKSVFFIGGRGVGKTRIIKCVPPIASTETSKWDTFTLGELDTYCSGFSGIGYDCSNIRIGVQRKNFVFKVEDFSTLGEYHREIFLTVCSKISSDGNYRHVTSITPNLSIDNCKLTMLIAIQLKLYSLLCNRYSQWESMSYDRFTKFLLLNPLRQGHTLDTDMIPTLPREISPSATLANSVDLSQLVELFRGHVSEGRAQLYARDYGIAMARFQGKNDVEQEDIGMFYRLFSPYLESFSRLQQRMSLDSTITVSSGHMELLTQIGKYLNGVTKQELSRSLMVTVRHIDRCASFLIEKRLLREEEGTYHLSTELEQFFNWYKDSFSLEMSPAQSPAQRR